VEAIFWGLVAMIFFVYAGYPALLLAMPRRKNVASGQTKYEWPAVTMLISAYNEVDCIKDKLENCIGLDYPADLLEIIVVSDASDDGTDEVVENFNDDRVSLLRMESRGGKTVGLNAGVAKSRGDVVVFSDANALYRQDSIRHLVASFDDPGIGAVIGESRYGDPDSQSGQSESLYWKYETTIKRLETASGSVVGGDGAIYAVRRSLYVPMDDGDLSDFVNPLQVVQAGYRCVYEPRALSYEETADSFAGEFRRKVRIVNRAWRALWKMRTMLNPFRFGGFSLKLWAHKVFRWLVPLFLVLLIPVNLLLVNTHAVYATTISVQLLFYALGIFGYNARHRQVQPAITRIPYYFCLVNLAAAAGLIEIFKGKSYATWNTVRG
jgi:cellulose synthase/poly-beta-1,6-N-acetylglucosamine synthase-like glycosyltransferase